MCCTPRPLDVLEYSRPQGAKRAPASTIVSGALHLTVGVAMLAIIAWIFVPLVRAPLFPGSARGSIVIMLLATLVPVAELAIGICCIGKRSLVRTRIGRLAANLTLLIYSMTVVMAMCAIAMDNRAAQWGGMTTIAGIILGVPSVLLAILSSIAMTRFRRQAREMLTF